MQTATAGNDPMAPSPYRAAVATALGVVVSAVVALIGMFHPGFHLSPAEQATLTQTLIPVVTVAIVALTGWYQHGHHKLELAKITSAATTDVIGATPEAPKAIQAMAHTDLMSSAGLTPADAPAESQTAR